MDSKAAVADIPRDLECSICGDVFDKAVSLKACGHTFCSVCIRNHWVTTSRPGIHRQPKKECPLCRTAVGNDVNKALVVNRAIQQAVKAFKPASVPLSSSAKIECYTNESPIKKRIQSRNYAGMKRNGKKELQKVCKEYNLTWTGNEQELVDRLRCFECMWNAELDTIDTPIEPLELVAKFKKKERMQREEKSRDIMTGKINDSKHMKKLTSSLLDDENKRNDKTISATSSGNVVFDAKFKSNFAELIAEGRRRMKKKSCRSSPRKIVCLRTYDDDGIHDSPERNKNASVSCDDKSDMSISTSTSKVKYLERKPSKGSAKIESSVGNQLSEKKKKCVYNPYKSDRKRKFQDPSIHSTTNNIKPFTVGGHTPNKLISSAQLRPSQSPKETTIHNPYKKKQLRHHQTPSPGLLASLNAKRGNLDLGSLPTSSDHNLRMSQRSDKTYRDRIPLSQQANNMTFTTEIKHKKLDGRKIPRLRSSEIGILSDNAGITRVTQTPKKITNNPYK